MDTKIENLVDIVIPLGNGSKWNNNELKYAIRSIEKFVKNYRNIYIIGKCPDWLTSLNINSKIYKDVINSKNIISPYNKKFIIHVPFGDTSYKTDNIRNKILEACRTKEISNNFFFTNDDIFFTKTIDVINYPYYYDKNLIDIIKDKNIDSYLTSLNNTYITLIKQDQPVKHYDIHCPIIYNKDKFKLIINSNNWNLRYGFTIKSLYSNTLKVEGKKINDFKIRKPLNLGEINKQLYGKSLFSIDDDAINIHLIEKLEKLYPEKSKYEK